MPSNKNSHRIETGQLICTANQLTGCYMVWVFTKWCFWTNYTKQTITCSKSTIETVKQVVKYVQRKQKRHQNNVDDVVLVSSLLNLNVFHTLFQFFYCWLWAGNCLLGSNVSKSSHFFLRCSISFLIDTANAT